MLRALLALTLAMILCSVVSAQQPNPRCPTISLTGPPGLPETGKLVPFTVEVKPAVSQLVYKWSVSSGSVAAGQGTQSIGVKLDPNGGVLTATVEITGLPQDCPTIASETAAWGDIPPRTTRIDTYPLPIGSIKDERFRSIIDALKNNPTSQIYILVPGVAEVRSAIFERLKKVVNPSVDPSYITVVDTAEKNNLVEVWLVPPGAAPPSKCESCESSPKQYAAQDCPGLSVSGPPGVTAPGGLMSFELTLSDSRGKQLSLDWNISTGTIIGGQGTRIIKVIAPTDMSYGGEVTATVSVKDIARACSKSASSSARVAAVIGPEPIDSYGPISLVDEKARLQNAAENVKSDSAYKLLIIRSLHRVTVADKTRIRNLATFLNKLGLVRKQFQFIVEQHPDPHTLIWVVRKDFVYRPAK